MTNSTNIRRVEVTMEYGIDLDELDADVEEHAVNTVVQHFHSVGVLA